jgi:hypothetical protein
MLSSRFRRVSRSSSETAVKGAGVHRGRRVRKVVRGATPECPQTLARAVKGATAVRGAPVAVVAAARASGLPSRGTPRKSPPRRLSCLGCRAARGPAATVEPETWVAWAPRATPPSVSRSEDPYTCSLGWLPSGLARPAYARRCTPLSPHGAHVAELPPSPSLTSATRRTQSSRAVASLALHPFARHIPPHQPFAPHDLSTPPRRPSPKLTQTPRISRRTRAPDRQPTLRGDTSPGPKPWRAPFCHSAVPGGAHVAKPTPTAPR